MAYDSEQAIVQNNVPKGRRQREPRYWGQTEYQIPRDGKDVNVSPTLPRDDISSSQQEPQRAIPHRRISSMQPPVP